MLNKRFWTGASWVMKHFDLVFDFLPEEYNFDELDKT